MTITDRSSAAAAVHQISKTVVPQSQLPQAAHSPSRLKLDLREIFQISIRPRPLFLFTVLMQRGRSRRKVSVIGALVISLRRRRVRAYFGLLPDANFDGDAILAFLKQLRCALGVPMALIWDRLGAHLGEPVASWLMRNRHRVCTHLLPPYAPELNPVELIWAHAKSNPLANFAPAEIEELLDQTQVSTLAIGDDEALLRSFLKHCPLSLRLR